MAAGTVVIFAFFSFCTKYFEKPVEHSVLGAEKAAARAAPDMVESGSGKPTAENQSALTSAPAPAEEQQLNSFEKNEKYPGTLGDQVMKALDSRDGVMAMKMANELFRCDMATRMQARAGSLSTEEAELQKSASFREARAESQRERQRTISNCQTVAGGIIEMRARLLLLATEQRVVGAAAKEFATGVRRPEVLKFMVEDAREGDLNTLASVAGHSAAFFGISSEAHNILRSALRIAAEDREVGQEVQLYLELAESLSVALGGEVKKKFDSTNLSAEDKEQARIIAEKIIKRMRPPRS
ncbi:hypothetical protein HNP55_004730 [Paucibacter oligotrophus]|uniref:Uncharacterized protein n=1 Tax=Roseateles oligotrophus TaxID=1769250 RepID=A0A840LDD0_9BURK|nr:hypothetical protein [Roseateles oligotrophus]MBB4846176.1 hypothetical protein [Roseateles oligotrophus]